MKSIGMIMWIGAGAVTWFFMMSSMYQWWGVGGVIGGFIFVPGIVIFPLLYWLMESTFPVLYFSIWGVGVLGLIFYAVGNATQKQ